ncbi:MAG: hypothetical protein IJU79_00085 [Desulfovibrionaceae bacterium]|nr:hypothetical protein [Desulfovibrionaceae bacterium]
MESAVMFTDIKKQYLELLKNSLTNELYKELEINMLYWAIMNYNGKQPDILALVDPQKYIPEIYNYVNERKTKGMGFYYYTDAKGRRIDLRNYCDYAYSMIGKARMDNIEFCLDIIRNENIPGDLLETGVCRGGAVIFMKGYLYAYNINNKHIFAADSYQGLPEPSRKEDENLDLSVDKYPCLAISLEKVKETFKRYNLLDDQIIFLKGWFKDTLPNAPIKNLCLLRLDGDLYESTYDSLEYCYHKVVEGGFVIIDDYETLSVCKKAVNDFRNRNNITEKIEKIDESSIFWRITNRKR